MNLNKVLAAGIIFSAFAVTSSAAIIAEYNSGAGAPLSPTTQGWYATQILEETPGRPLATVINTTGDGTLANAGPGATGWIVRDYLDGQADGEDDRPEYNFDLTTADFTAMQTNGWRFTSIFKMDNVITGSPMRVLSLGQSGGNYLPFDIKVNARDDVSGNLFLDMSMEDGAGEGTLTSFDTGVLASQFNTIIMEDVDGDGTFTININGNPLLNTYPGTPSFLFDVTAPSNAVALDDILVIGAEFTGAEGGGIEYDLVRLETIPEPSTSMLALLAIIGLVTARARRV